MPEIKFIMFDCMETLVDLYKLPELRDYAMWAYEGSSVENCFDGFDGFFEGYKKARESIAKRLPQNKEYENYEKMLEVVRLASSLKEDREVHAAAKKLYANYWANYKAQCYIKEDVREVLPELAGRYHLGVVSNFMVDSGIEELLQVHGLSCYFDFIVTSVKCGWRKPHTNIYRQAIVKSGFSEISIMFVGDDYINDYVTPGELGMKSVLLDRYNKHPEVKSRITDFHELLTAIRS